MLLSSISETTYIKNGTSVGFYSTGKLTVQYLIKWKLCTQSYTQSFPKLKIWGSKILIPFHSFPNDPLFGCIEWLENAGPWHLFASTILRQLDQ